MSQKHRRHKYRPLRQSNPVSSHFLSLYSNYNNIINYFSDQNFLFFHQSIISEHRNETFRMPKSKVSITVTFIIHEWAFL